MGTKGITKDKKQEEELFTPYVIKCEDIVKEIRNASKVHRVPRNEIDFDIISFVTYIRTTEHQKKESEWTEVDGEILKKFKDEKFLVLSDLDIKQIYEIRIRPINTDELKLDIVITANKIFTRVSAIIKASSNLEYSPELYSKLVENLNKKKIKIGILVGLFDDNMRNNLKDLILKLKEEVDLKEDFRVKICECIDPIKPIDDVLVYHYKNKNEKVDEHGRVDYANRDFLFTVVQAELLMEYIKPKLGRGGRNCKGKFIPVEEPKTEYLDDLKFNITDKMEKKEDDDSIVWISKANGYVDFEGGTYDISDKLDVDEVSFKKTGSINAGEDTDIKINVKEKGDMSDAIGSGVKVTVAEANIEGSVGDGAEVNGGIIKVGGQTHGNSIITADKAEINIHKGFVKAKDVKITRLENGRVEGEIVRISEAIGGEVRAKEIYIDTVKSHSVFKASRLIDIKKIVGDDNKFIVDPLALSTDANLIGNIKTAIGHLKKDIEMLAKKYALKTKDIQTTLKAAEIVKKRIAQSKAEGSKPEIGDIMKLKQYQSMITELKSTKGQVTQKEEKLNKLQSDLDKIQEAIFDARIINNDSWNGFNSIKFELVNPDRVIEHIPRGYEREIRLIYDEDSDDFKIETES